MDSAQALFQMLAWQVTNSRGYASSPTSRDLLMSILPWPAVNGLTKLRDLPRKVATIFDAFPKMLSPLVQSPVTYLGLATRSVKNAGKIYGENTVIAMPPRSWISRGNPLFSWYDVTARGFPVIADRNVEAATVLILPHSINHNFINRGWVIVIFGKYSNQHQYLWYKTERNSFSLTLNGPERPWMACRIRYRPAIGYLLIHWLFRIILKRVAKKHFKHQTVWT